MNFALIIINIILVIFFKVFKINKRKVIYIPVHFRYEGNAKALLEEWIKSKNFLHIYLCHNNIESLTNLKNNYKNVIFLRFGIKFLYHFSTAKYLIRESEYNSIGLISRKETTVIQLWHAAGAFKKFGLDIENRSSFLKRNRKIDIHTWDTIFCSSKYIVDIYSKAFGGFDKNKIFVSGLPRNDSLYNLNKQSDKVKSKLGIKKNVKIVLYAPTFRDKMPADKYRFIVETANFLSDNLHKYSILAVRLHPSIPKAVMLDVNSKIINLNACQTEEALVIADMLITDYSSIIFDYALLEKPIIFYAPDLDTYYDKRGFYFDYEDFIPGPICKNKDCLLNNILNYSSNKWLNKVKEFKENFNPYFDGKNTKRVLDKILQLNKEKLK